MTKSITYVVKEGQRYFSNLASLEEEERDQGTLSFKFFGVTLLDLVNSYIELSSANSEDDFLTHNCI